MSGKMAKKQRRESRLNNEDVIFDLLNNFDIRLGLYDGRNGLLSVEENRMICEAAERTFAKTCGNYFFSTGNEEEEVRRCWKDFNDALLDLENIVRRGAKRETPFTKAMRTLFSDQKLVLFLD